MQETEMSLEEFKQFLIYLEEVNNKSKELSEKIKIAISKNDYRNLKTLSTEVREGELKIGELCSPEKFLEYYEKYKKHL